MDVDCSPEWVIVGKFGRPQGVRGLVRVISFTDPHENILQYPDWFVQKKRGEWETVTRVETSIAPRHILAQLEGYATREAAALLTHLEIAVPKAALPTLIAGTYYWHELIGMQVVHETGKVLGVVDSILETGSNDVLVVLDLERRRLIPYLLDDVITEINALERVITVRWDPDF